MGRAGYCQGMDDYNPNVLTEENADACLGSKYNKELTH